MNLRPMKKQSQKIRRKKGNEDKRLAGGAIGGTIFGASLGGPPGAIIGGLIGLFIADSVNEEKKKSGRLTLNKRKYMADKKVVFVAFAIEDETQRNFLVGQSLHTESPFEFTDMSVKEPYDSGWKEKVRTRIRRSDGVIVLVSKNCPNSSGQAWEISCAKEEKKPILAIWAYRDDRTILAGVNTVGWAWPTIEKFIDGL